MTNDLNCEFIHFVPIDEFDNERRDHASSFIDVLASLCSEVCSSYVQGPNSNLASWIIINCTFLLFGAVYPVAELPGGILPNTK